MTASSTTEENGISNHSSACPLTDGIYVPTVAFFTPDNEIDVETTKAHATRLAHAGVAGLVTHGSNGEAVHLDHDERKLITRATRDALDQTGNQQLPLIAGCGAQSTRETIELCREAADSGASHALVLPPAYYKDLLTLELIQQHFRKVAEQSPIPILIYNFPAACAGLDLNSDTILALAEHPNIVGVKLTCGNTGKLARVVAGTKGTAFKTFAGSVDFTIQALSVGGHGVIGGTANIAPRTCVQLMQLWRGGNLKEATVLQEIVSRGDWAAIKGGFIAVKAALERYYGYGGQPRKPCAPLEGRALDVQLEGFLELVDLEQKLEGDCES
ncbi:dihydrodipicolinate synthetase family [Fusarium albosuccineum]|uniref:Dihydrodipicolinate synthetase family n=1 Tax=Fusarium albosuccineum TaxID=1237068 RepID=A0A8H4LCX0_9HYPO|nr:dihydrodipicolinate synthetase family [Fusarium albosuccineum]